MTLKHTVPIVGALLFAPLASLHAAEPPAHVAGAGPGRRGTSGISLEQAFASPSAATRPFVYYWWGVKGPLFNKESITEDMESMSQQGIKGMRFFAHRDYMTPEWLPQFGHILEEAKRLDLQIQLNNDPTQSCRGIPWMTDEMAAKKVVYSETAVEGGRRILVPLAVPEINDAYYKQAVSKVNGLSKVKRSEVNQYYRDIAVLAYRVSPGSQGDNAPAAGIAAQYKTAPNPYTCRLLQGGWISTTSRSRPRAVRPFPKRARCWT